MKITVLNGSPKGITSVTMQYIHYIQKQFPQHELKIFNISQNIAKIQKDEDYFNGILDEITSSNGVLWASPVYYLLIPANLKRFIELISERKAEDRLRNMYTAFLSTSIHFFDHSAHNYIHAVCDDLNMRYTGSFSADMYDLRRSSKREALRLFAENFFNAIEESETTWRRFAPLNLRDFEYTPENTKNKVNSDTKKILIVTDSGSNQNNLEKMVEKFKASFSSEVELVNLNDLDIEGSCLGCIHCGYDNKCVYDGKDDFIEFYNKKIKGAHILVWAGAIKDRYLSAKWKTFFDRSFFNGHAPSLSGKQIGFIISGPLSQNANLRQILEAYIEVQQANCAGFVTDEYGDSAYIDSLLENLGRRMVRFAEGGYTAPSTFLGVGGHKIFRDDIWGRLRFPFYADHKSYKKMDFYDFPQKKRRMRIVNAIMLFLSRSPAFRKKVNARIKEEMIKPLQKVL